MRSAYPLHPISHSHTGRPWQPWLHHMALLCLATADWLAQEWTSNLSWCQILVPKNLELENSWLVQASWPKDLSAQEPWGSCVQRNRKGSCAREEWEVEARRFQDAFLFPNPESLLLSYPSWSLNLQTLLKVGVMSHQLFKYFPFLLKLLNVLQVKGPQLGQPQRASFSVPVVFQ